MHLSKISLFTLLVALPVSAQAQGLFGFGGGEERIRLGAPVEVTDIPDWHWNFSMGEGDYRWRVRNYSPNLDGVGFDNIGIDGQGGCYGHTLLSTRWFQYLVKPLKNGTVSEITPDEFTDFWGGHMTAPISQSLTPSNIDHARLARFSTYSDQSRMAVGRLVGYYQSYQMNLFDHGRELYSDPAAFRRDLVYKMVSNQLPPQVSLRGRESGGHSVLAYEVRKGTATLGNTDGSAGTRREAYQILLYDPNRKASNDVADDATNHLSNTMIVFEGAGGLVGFGEFNEALYDEFLGQSASNPAGTWNIPSENYGLPDTSADDDGEIRSWHWSQISDEEARIASGLSPAPDAD